jgi:competence transcription factor ComK
MNGGMVKMEFLNIKGKSVPLNSDKVCEIHSINVKQTLVTFNNGFREIINTSFEALQFYLVDNCSQGKIWVYMPGICGHMSMFDPEQIKDISSANPDQTEITFVSNRHLFVDMAYKDVCDRINLSTGMVPCTLDNKIID